MWTTGLLALAAVMLFSASEVDSQIYLSCCFKTQPLKPSNQIKVCYEQKARHGCRHHAFVLKMYNGKTICVKPTPWLRNRINKGELKCPPEFYKKTEKKI